MSRKVRENFNLNLYKILRDLSYDRTPLEKKKERDRESE